MIMSNRNSLFTWLIVSKKLLIQALEHWKIVRSVVNMSLQWCMCITHMHDNIAMTPIIMYAYL